MLSPELTPYVGPFPLAFLMTIIVKKTSQFKTVCKDDSGYITQLKQQKSKR